MGQSEVAVGCLPGRETDSLLVRSRPALITEAFTVLETLRRAVFFLAAAAAVLGFANPCSADDWPQWRGSNRDGVSQETGLLQSWPAEGPRRVWLSDTIGLGYGGPAVVDGRIFILGTRGGSETLFCLDADSSDEVWSVDLGTVYENDWGDGPRGTPTVVGDRVYALAANGRLVCVERAGGQEVWSTAMQEFGGQLPKWGYSESPLVLGGKVLCTPGGEQGAMVALDAATGEMVWQSDHNTQRAHYSSIVPWAPHGETTCVQLLVNEAIGFRPEDGEVLWTVPWPGRVAVVPTPIVRGNRVYVTAGYGTGCKAVDVAADNEVSEAYDNKTMVNHHGGAILLGEHVYGYSDGKGWVCQDFESGERTWREREALGKGAIAYADGRFYCQSEDEGEIVLIAADPDGWEEHGRFVLAPQSEQRASRGKVWTHPVIANGRLYLRDQEYLHCFDISAAAGRGGSGALGR